MTEGKNPHNPEVEHNDTDDRFEIEITDEELKRLMDEQGEMKDAGFHSQEKIIATAVADEVKLLIEQNSPALGIDSSKLVIKESGSGDAIYMVGSSEVGYINISVSGSDLHLTIPPTFNAISEIIKQGAHHVFDGGGKAGPRGV